MYIPIPNPSIVAFSGQLSAMGNALSVLIHPLGMSVHFDVPKGNVSPIRSQPHKRTHIYYLSSFGL